MHTFQFLVETAPTRYWERTYEFFEIDRPIFVFIEDIEDIVCKLARISKWKELFVNPTELSLVQMAGRAIFKKAPVPYSKYRMSALSL